MTIDPAAYEATREPDRRILATGPGAPSDDVVAALEDGLVKVIRRVEIYESDAKVLWNPDVTEDPNFNRIVDGNVNVDYSSDERRVLDLILDNRDMLLRPDPIDGLWYDKIIKVYRGVSFIGGATPPRVAIADAPSNAAAIILKQFLSTLGYIDIDIVTNYNSISELRDYPVVFSFTGTSATTKHDLYTQLWNSGTHIFTIGSGNRSADLPHYFDESQVSPSGDWQIMPTAGDSPVVGSFVTGPGGSGTGYAPLSVAVGVLPLALGTHPNTGTETITAALATSPSGAFWTDLHLPTYVNGQPKKFLSAISDWVRGVGLEIEWETQIGEFMVDGLNWAHFPDQVKITGRDYTKKMKSSKLGSVTTFASGTKLRDMVIALATNSGIDPLKMRVGIGDEVLTSDMSYEVGADRWTIAKEACASYNYEIFFDAFGWFTVRKFIDPYAGAISWTFKTGEEGNLVSFDKSLSDSEIYNHVIVTASPADEEIVLPYRGEAKNESLESPTSIARLGNRVLVIEADYLNSDAECQKLAEDTLKIVALEQYALNTQTIYYPWMEVGEVSEILDPDANEFEPTRYLLTTLGFTLGLGPMTGTAKRITFVGDSGTVSDEEDTPSETYTTTVRWRPSTTAASPTIAWSNIWDTAGTLTRKHMMRVGSPANLSTSSAEVADEVAPQTQYMQQLIGEELAPGALVGNFRSVWLTDAILTTQNPERYLRVIARVMSSDGLTERGIIFNGTTTPVSTSADQIRVCGGPLIPGVTAQAGDILVVEVGGFVGTYPSDPSNYGIRLLPHSNDPDLPYEDGPAIVGSSWVELELVQS